MPDCLADAQPVAIPVPFSPLVLKTGFVDRRRPGRNDAASPELIGLMRKPGAAARIRVAMYDAPGFLLQADHRRPRMAGQGGLHMAIAMLACSVLTAVAIKFMLIAWG